MTTHPIELSPPERGKHGRQVWSDFWTRDWGETDWLFEDVLAVGRGHAIWAKHGQQKSLFMLWVSTELVKAGNVVIYLDWEMSDADLFERLRDMGYGPHVDLSRLIYINRVDLPPLDTVDGGQQLGELLDDIGREFRDHHVVVVIDTFSRAVAGKENDNDTVQAFYRHTGQALRSRGVTWVRLDHAGHDGDHARGASAKGDDVDIVWRLSKTDSGLSLRCDKRRMGWVPTDATFRRVEDGHLRFERPEATWPDGTEDTARILDALDIPLTASVRNAQVRLRESGNSRRRAVVGAAQRYRRSLSERHGNLPATRPQAPREPRPEPALGQPIGNYSGSTPENTRRQGAEPPREPLGTGRQSAPGTTPVSHAGTGVPIPGPGVIAQDDWRQMVPAGFNTEHPFGGDA